MVAFGKAHYYYEDTKSNKSSMDQQSIIVDIIGVFFLFLWFYYSRFSIWIVSSKYGLRLMFWVLLGAWLDWVPQTESTPASGSPYCRDISPSRECYDNDWISWSDLRALEELTITLTLEMINGPCWVGKERKSLGQTVGRSERKWPVLSGQAIKPDDFRISTQERCGEAIWLEERTWELALKLNWHILTQHW